MAGCHLRYIPQYITMLSISTAGLRVLCLLTALAILPHRSFAQEARPVVVFAAASLQTALNAIATEWRKETGKRVTFSFAGSPALARQIEQGAPADVFASADAEWMDWAQERKLIRAETRREFLGNALVLVAARGDAIDLKIATGFALESALRDSRLAMGDPQSVPVGRYARAALQSLGVWKQVSARIAGVDNTRAALALVARGEARLGIVYRTDALAELRVRIVDTFPATSHPPIVYPFALTAPSTNPDAAGFLEFLRTPAATRIFEAEGFGVKH
jgi:molybdate transport system substrate-binding protein